MKLSGTRKITILSFLLLIIIFQFGCTNREGAGNINPVNLRCERMSNPEGIDVARLRLSWELTSGIRSQKQTAYQVLVASSPELLKSEKR